MQGQADGGEMGNYRSAWPMHQDWGWDGAPSGARARRRRRARRAVPIAAAVAVALGANGLAFAALQGTSGASTVLLGSPTKLLASSTALNAAKVAADVDPAIVDVNTTLAGDEGTAAGTGMVVTSNGYIVTNNHVVEDAVSIKVTIPGKGTYSAHVIGVDVAKDIAVIKIDGVKDLTTARFASSPAGAGTAVVAIGNAHGKGGTPTATVGRIVAEGQDITAATGTGGAESLAGLIESEVAIEPGDSGGPLVNARGEVVGMDTAAEEAMAGQTSTVGYSIPISTVMSVVKQIMSGESGDGVIMGSSSFLGVLVTGTAGPGEPFSPPGLAATSGQGVVIDEVLEASPAAKAGLQAGDEVLSVDGHAVISAAQLEKQLTAHRPGSSVTLKVLTPAGAQTVHVTLTTAPAE